MTIVDLIDTPRIYTAFAEWIACFLYLLMFKKKFKSHKLILSFVSMLGVLILYQYIAGTLPIFLWIPGMLGAILLMFSFIYLVGDLSILDSWFICARAFVLAEFAASFGWQIYTWWAIKSQKQNQFISSFVMISCYIIIFSIYYLLEKKHIPHNDRLQVTPKELTGATTIAFVAFAMSNLSFISLDTPFSTGTNSILYVRSLIDFGGLIMLFAQQDKREEFRLRSENQAMNIVLQRQYDQYQLAQDNIDLIGRELHDLKHYLIAIRSESDQKKREYYLEELEHAIMMHGALSNTGNKILDVVLTTKSTYCIQKKITFSCMADGALVNFMDVKDICSIFGNAMDNAIECVEKYEDLEQRVINLSMYQKNQLLMIQVENYYNSTVTIDGTLPKTTKKNHLYHGYGLKSIRLAAEKYEGSMTLHGKDNWFTLQILIPIRM